MADCNIPDVSLIAITMDSSKKVEESNASNNGNTRSFDFEGEKSEPSSAGNENKMNDNTNTVDQEKVLGSTNCSVDDCVLSGMKSDSLDLTKEYVNSKENDDLMKQLCPCDIGISDDEIEATAEGIFITQCDLSVNERADNVDGKSDDPRNEMTLREIEKDTCSPISFESSLQTLDFTNFMMVHANTNDTDSENEKSCLYGFTEFLKDNNDSSELLLTQLDHNGNNEEAVESKSIVGNNVGSNNMKDEHHECDDTCKDLLSEVTERAKSYSLSEKDTKDKDSFDVMCDMEIKFDSRTTLYHISEGTNEDVFINDYEESAARLKAFEDCFKCDILHSRNNENVQHYDYEVIDEGKAIDKSEEVALKGGILKNVNEMGSFGSVNYLRSRVQSDAISCFENENFNGNNVEGFQSMARFQEEIVDEDTQPIYSFGFINRYRDCNSNSSGSNLSNNESLIKPYDSTFHGLYRRNVIKSSSLKPSGSGYTILDELLHKMSMSTLDEKEERAMKLKERYCEMQTASKFHISSSSLKDDVKDERGKEFNNSGVNLMTTGTCAKSIEGIDAKDISKEEVHTDKLVKDEQEKRITGEKIDSLLPVKHFSGPIKISEQLSPKNSHNSSSIITRADPISFPPNDCSTKSSARKRNTIMGLPIDPKILDGINNIGRTRSQTYTMNNATVSSPINESSKNKTSRTSVKRLSSFDSVSHIKTVKRIKRLRKTLSYLSKRKKSIKSTEGQNLNVCAKRRKGISNIEKIPKKRYKSK